MLELQNQNVLVAGLDEAGVTACQLLRRSGARVSALDTFDPATARHHSHRLRALGIPVTLAFLIGEVSQTIRSAWGLFTPCKPAPSLLEAVAEAARNATSGDVVLLSPACSGLDQFRNHQHRGQTFCNAVKSIGRGDRVAHPNRHGFQVPASLLG